MKRGGRTLSCCALVVVQGRHGIQAVGISSGKWEQCRVNLDATTLLGLCLCLPERLRIG